MTCNTDLSHAFGNVQADAENLMMKKKIESKTNHRFEYFLLSYSVPIKLLNLLRINL